MPDEMIAASVNSTMALWNEIHNRLVAENGKAWVAANQDLVKALLQAAATIYAGACCG